MRGLLALAKGAAAPTAAQACGGCGANPQLRTALQRVTHSDSAAVPPDVLQEAVRLAAESEESLASALRHVEENVAAPAREWRRIHGALTLLERLMRPRQGGADEAPLIGSLWFEAKMQQRLEALAGFQYGEDSRVSLLVRRAAAATQATAERYVLSEAGQQDLFSGVDGGSSRVPHRSSDSDGGGHGASASSPGEDGPGADEASASSTSRTANPQDGSKVPPTVIGQTSREAQAAATGKLRNAASALEALNDPGTRAPCPQRVDSGLGGGPASAWRRCLRRCFGGAEDAASPREAQDTDTSETETNTLLARSRLQIKAATARPVFL